MKKENKLHTSEEILNALHVIQGTCEYYLVNGYENCRKCPLCTIVEDSPTCTIADLEPDNWSIADNPDTTWRAFKR